MNLNSKNPNPSSPEEEELLIKLTSPSLNPTTAKQTMVDQIAVAQYLEKLKTQQYRGPRDEVSIRKFQFKLAQEACEEALNFARIRYAMVDGRKISFTKKLQAEPPKQPSADEPKA